MFYAMKKQEFANSNQRDSYAAMNIGRAPRTASDTMALKGAKARPTRTDMDKPCERRPAEEIAARGPIAAAIDSLFPALLATSLLSAAFDAMGYQVSAAGLAIPALLGAAALLRLRKTDPGSWEEICHPWECRDRRYKAWRKKFEEALEEFKEQERAREQAEQERRIKLWKLTTPPDERGEE